jgi:hypothetical protein
MKMKGYKTGKGQKFKVQSPSTMGRSARKTRTSNARTIVVRTNGVVGTASKGGKRVY